MSRLSRWGRGVSKFSAADRVRSRGVSQSRCVCGNVGACWACWLPSYCFLFYCTYMFKEQKYKKRTSTFRFERYIVPQTRSWHFGVVDRILIVVQDHILAMVVAAWRYARMHCLRLY